MAAIRGYFSGAIASGLEGAAPGEAVRVMAANGRFIAAGYANPKTTIAVRVLTLDDEAVDARLIGRRLDEALTLRRAVLPAGLEAYRVVNGEGDRLPGVTVDRYGEFLVCQFLTAGAAQMAPAVVEGLVERLAPRGVFERSEGGVRAEEGIAGVRGVLAGEEPPALIEIVEDGARFLVDVAHGQKTGFFLDQRESRRRVRELAAGKRVLNAFAYTGALSVVAGLGGAAEVISVDTSRPALEIAERAWLAERAPARERQLRRRRRVRRAPERAGEPRRDRAGSSPVRAPPARSGLGSPRLQGREPASDPTSGTGRLARHGVVLAAPAAHRLPRRGAGGRVGRWPGPHAGRGMESSAGSSCRARASRGRVPESAAAPRLTWPRRVARQGIVTTRGTGYPVRPWTCGRSIGPGRACRACANDCCLAAGAPSPMSSCSA